MGIGGEWEERFRKLEDRQRRSELESEEKLRIVQDKLDRVEAELRTLKAEMDARLAELPVCSFYLSVDLVRLTDDCSRYRPTSLSRPRLVHPEWSSLIHHR